MSKIRHKRTKELAKPLAYTAPLRPEDAFAQIANLLLLDKGKEA